MKTLEELKIEYKNLGDRIKRIENSESKKWFKIFASQWLESDGTTSRYQISYIDQKVLSSVNGEYFILKEYANKQEVIDEVKQSENLRAKLQWCYNYINKQGDSDEKQSLIKELKNLGCS